MRDRDDARAVGNHVGQVAHDKGAITFQRKGTYYRAGFFGNKLPGNDIRVVIGNADQDFVARLQSGFRPTAGNKIQCHRRARCQHNFITRIGPDKLRDLAAYGFIEIGRCLGQKMQPAMDVGIGILIGGQERIQHLFRLLRRCSAVQIDKWFPVNATL